MSFPAEKRFASSPHSFLDIDVADWLDWSQHISSSVKEVVEMTETRSMRCIYLASPWSEGSHKPSFHNLPHLSSCHFYLKQLTNLISEYHVNSTTHEHSLQGHVELLHLRSSGRYPLPEVHRQFLVLTEGESKGDCFWHCKHDTSFKRTSWTSYPSTSRGNSE